MIDNHEGTVVKISTDSFVDIHAISHLKGKTSLSDRNAAILAEFTDYAYLRADKKTSEFKQGGGNWERLSFPAEATGLSNDISSGIIDEVDFVDYISSDTKIQVNSFPELVVLKDFANSEFTLSVTNLTNKAVDASLSLPAITAYSIPQSNFQLGLIPAYQTHSTRISLGRYSKPAGIDALPIYIHLDNSDQPVSHGIMVSAGPGLVENYDDINNPSYRIHTYSSSIDVSMRDGGVQRIRDKQGNEIYSGQPLFKLSDGQTSYSSLGNTIKTSYTWPNKEQASVITEINNLIRWQLLTIQDRFYVKLDDVYTRLDTVSFVFDKQNSAIDWNGAHYVAEGKKALLSSAHSKIIDTRALELPLNDSNVSICINNLASRQWINTNESLGLVISRNKNEQWSFGICDHDALEEWTN